MSDRQQDDHLMARVAAGDGAAFGPIVERHARALFRLARAYSRDEASAEDVVQQALVDALRGAVTYRPGVSSVRTWLFTITRNAARRRGRVREIAVEAVPEPDLLVLGIDAGWGAPDERLLQAEATVQLARGIASLAPRDREVLVLRDVEGLSGEQAARVLEIGERAMKSRLHRARLRLMAALRGSADPVSASEREAGGLRCREVLALLDDYVAAAASSEARVAVEEHLRACEICERFGGRYANLVHELRVSLGAPPAVDPATFARVVEKLRSTW